MTTKLSKQFIEKVRAVTAKRPKTVIDHILAHGQVTTDELKALMANATALNVSFTWSRWKPVICKSITESLTR